MGCTAVVAVEGVADVEEGVKDLRGVVDVGVGGTAPAGKADIAADGDVVVAVEEAGGFFLEVGAGVEDSSSAGFVFPCFPPPCFFLSLNQGFFCFFCPCVATITVSS